MRFCWPVLLRRYICSAGFSRSWSVDSKSCFDSFYWLPSFEASSALIESVIGWFLRSCGAKSKAA